MARPRRPLLIPAVVVVLLALASLGWAWKKTDPSFRRFAGFFRKSEVTATWAVLEEVRDLRQLETAAYTLKAIFPFDFVEKSTDWRYLRLHYERDPAAFRSKADPAWHIGGKLPERWRGAEIYALCREVGIDPGLPDFRFIVVAATVRAGLDLDPWFERAEGGNPKEPAPGIGITESEEGGRILTLPDPDVRVTAFVIEDRDAAAEGYPDVPISPEDWRRVAETLGPAIHAMAMEKGLLVEAADRGRSFLTDIFTGAGFRRVAFE